MKLNFFLKKIFLFVSPFLLGMFLILLSKIPFSFLPYYHQSFPFVLTLIFYFAVFNPSFLNVFCVFILGLLADFISSVPVGFNTFIYVFFFFVANFLRPYFFSMFFYQLWIIFALLLLCSDVIWAFLFFMISGVWVSTGFWFVQYIFTLLSYPIFCYFYGFLNRKIKECQ